MQGVYILITALWPIVNIDSFIYVTGPKTDIWLVKTVGGLLVPVGLCLLSFLFTNSDRVSAIVLGGGTALAFGIIDFYYALADVIPRVYLGDGVIEILFLIGWTVIAARKYS